LGGTADLNSPSLLWDGEFFISHERGRAVHFLLAIRKYLIFKILGEVNIMKKLLSTFIALMLLVAMVGCSSRTDTTTSADEKVNLGIIQIVEHPSLDAARNGFLDALKDNGYVVNKNLVVDYQNAQGDQGNLQTIARKLVQDKNDLVLAVATPSAIAMANETTELPVLITAVTDPVSAKLVKSNDKPETNITGTNDLNPVKDQLQLIKDIVPKAKKIGIIYNASEINSQIQVDIADKAAPELGLDLVKVTVTASSEVMQAAQSLAGRVDAIYLPTDNMVISSVSAVIKVAEDNKIPLVTGEADSVENGALATVGIDYYQLGRTTGEMAVRILKGDKPQDMAIESQEGSNLIINLKAAERMGVAIPDDIKDKAQKLITQ
jgi:putative ABC transport system substrate-binding protein